MANGLWLAVRKRKRDPGAILFLQLVAATVPVVAAGFAMEKYLGGPPRSLAVIAWTTLGFGLLLWLADRIGMTIRRIEHMTWGGALFIGFAQVLALIPGTSRSGITMTAARFLGYERADSARFSMLMSIPTIVGAGILEGARLYRADDALLTFQAFAAVGFAFVAALVAIALMMAWLRRASFTPFVVYRIALGAFLLWWAGR
jgi:undecaprenyl-diphosphatase